MFAVYTPRRDHPLAVFECAPNHFRFETRRYIGFTLCCTIVALLGGIVIFAWDELDAAGFLMIAGLAAVCTWWTTAIAHWHRWFEIVDHGGSFSIRGRYGLLRWSHDVAKNRIAMACVEEGMTSGLFGTRYHRYVALYLHDRPPPALAHARPICLALHEMPVSLGYEICKLLAPGLTDTTYLLNVDDANKPRRSHKPRAR